MTPIVVLLLVTHSDGRDLPTAGIQRAIVDVLGAATVVSDEAPSTLPDHEAAQRGRAIHADVVYRLAWKRFEPPAIELRTWTRSTTDDDQWIIRRLDFGYSDSLTEIARTIGFAAAAMVPRYAPYARQRQAPAPEETGTKGPADSRLAVEHVPAPAAPPQFLLVDVLGSAGVSDDRSVAWGGGLRVSWTATRRLRPTMAVTGFMENVDAAQSRASQVALCLGGVLTLVASSRVTVALRTEAEAVLQMATRLSQSQGQTARQSRWLPALMPAVEASVALSSGTALVLAGGYEVAAGRTDIYVAGEKVATIPPSHATAELGLRVGF
jgi:hypothetical protein